MILTLSVRCSLFSIISIEVDKDISLSIVSIKVFDNVYVNRLLNTKFNMVRVANHSERYDDTVRFLTDVIKLKREDLNIEERNLLSIGFNNLFLSLRSFWKAVQSNKAYAFSISEFYKRHYLRAYSTAEWRNLSTYLRRHRRNHRWFEPKGSHYFIFIYYK